MALTEQEQIEIFSKWWKDNGTFLVVSVVVALGAYFGWTVWQSHQQARAEQASVIFQEIIDSRSGKAGASISELAEKLKKDYADTYYGEAVKLLLAEDAVKNGKLDVAENELTALVQQKPNETLLLTARLRLGRVLYAEGKYPEALLQLQEPKPEAYKGLFAELRGDVLVAQGQADAARLAYESALATLPKDNVEQKQTVEMKLNQLATAVANNAATPK